jgi:CxxC motif-containing protein
VMTQAPVPKRKVADVMKQINKVKVKAPVKMYDVIIENVARTGVNVVASRSMDAIK